MSQQPLDEAGKNRVVGECTNKDIPTLPNDTNSGVQLKFPKLSFNFKDAKCISRKVLTEVLLRFTTQDSSISPEQSDLVITDSLKISVELLEQGFNVLQLTSEKGLNNFDLPGRQLIENPKYQGRYLIANGLKIGEILIAIGKAPLKNRSTESYVDVQLDPNLELKELLGLSPIRDKHILVVDNSQLNRLSARFQLGEQNSLDICETYKKGAELLKSNRYDLVLLDLLMPPETFTLSSTAYSYVAGSEFPAGIFLALIAAQSGAKEIAVVTDVSHHDHPATALLDYVGWGKLIEVGGQTRLSFQAANVKKMAHSNERYKDWSEIKLFSE